MKSFVKTVTTKWTPEWIKHDFLVYGPDFRRARKRMRDQCNSCIACDHKFKDGEMMALGSFGKKGNKTLCQVCAKDLDA